MATKKCPFCAEEIQAEAVVCKHCNRDIAPARTATPARPAAPARKRNYGVLLGGAALLFVAVAGDVLGAPSRGMALLSLVGFLVSWAGWVQALPGGLILRVAVGLLAASIMLGVAAGFMTPPTAAPRPAGRATAPAAAAPRPAARTGITMAKFNQISEGMTYEQVVAIVGEPGELMSSSDLAGIKTVAYSWKNRNGSNMLAMFQNGAMVQKSQFGLP